MSDTSKTTGAPAVNDPDAKPVAKAIADAGKAADKTAPPQTKVDSKAVADRTAALIADGVGANEAKARAEVEVAQAKTAADEAAAASKARAKVSRADLAPAGESGDPEVHRLLAQRQGHMTNLADLTPVPNEDAAKVVRAAIADIDDRLAELGYRAS